MAKPSKHIQSGCLSVPPHHPGDIHHPSRPSTQIRQPTNSFAGFPAVEMWILSTSSAHVQWPIALQEGQGRHPATAHTHLSNESSRAEPGERSCFASGPTLWVEPRVCCPRSVGWPGLFQNSRPKRQFGPLFHFKTLRKDHQKYTRGISASKRALEVFGNPHYYVIIQ